MRRNVRIGVAVLAIGALAAFVLLVRSPIDACFDSGGWWDGFARKCECTDAELADPTVGQQRKAYCEARRQSPTSEQR
jgi:hypothetical protein